MAPANALAFDLPEVLRGLHHPAGLRRPDPDGLDRRPQPVGLLAVGVLHAIDTLEGKDHQGGIGPLPSRGQVIDIVARLYVGVARQAALPALVHPVVRAAGRGLHLRRQGGVLLQWGAQGPVDAVVVQHRLAIGVQRPGGGGASGEAGGGHGGEKGLLITVAKAVGLGQRLGGPQGERQGQNHRHTYRGQGHPRRIPLEPGDGGDAALDVLPAVGHGGGAGRPGVFLVGHGQEDAPVVPPVLPLQPLQHPLIAEGLQVVLHLVEGIPKQGVAPVNAPEQAHQQPPAHVAIGPVEQLVEEHLFVGLPPGGQGQHRGEEPADEGGGQPLHLDGPADGQVVPLRHPAERGVIGGGPPAEGQPQPQVGEGVPGQQRHYPRHVEKIERIEHPLGSAQPAGQGDGGGHPDEVIVPGEGGLGGLHQQGTVKQHIPAAPPGGKKQGQAQQSPDAALPPGRELVAEQSLDQQQGRRRAGGRQGLEQKGPEIGHVVTSLSQSPLSVVSACGENGARPYTSISSSSRRSSSRSWAVRVSSFKKAATICPAEPRYTRFSRPRRSAAAQSERATAGR